MNTYISKGRSILCRKIRTPAPPAIFTELCDLLFASQIEMSFLNRIYSVFFFAKGKNLLEKVVDAFERVSNLPFRKELELP